MPHVEKTILINVSPETAFEFIANQPERMPEWWEPMHLQERVTPAPTGLDSISRYVYQMLKVKIEGEHKVTAFEPNRRLRVETTSGIDSIFDFTFAPEGEGKTRLTVNVDYTTPGGLLGQLANKLVIEKKNEEDWENGLQNLKQILESGD